MVISFAPNHYMNEMILVLLLDQLIFIVYGALSLD